MIMENLIVYLIGLIAVLFVARKAYKTLSGKSGCSCGCGGSGTARRKKFLPPVVAAVVGATNRIS